MAKSLGAASSATEVSPVTRLFAVVLVAAFTLGSSSLSASAQEKNSRCSIITGVIHGVSVPRLEEGVLTGFDVTVSKVTGPLSGGEIFASLKVTRFLDDGSMLFKGTHRFAGTRAGTFTTSDRGVTSADGRMGNILTISEGACGFLLTTGTVDVETGELVLEYTGLVGAEYKTPNPPVHRKRKREMQRKRSTGCGSEADRLHDCQIN